MQISHYHFNSSTTFGNDPVLPSLKAILRDSDKINQIVIISFNKEVVKESKQLFPSIPVLWLLSNFEKHGLKEVLDFSRANNIEGININYNLIDKALADPVKEAGPATKRSL